MTNGKFVWIESKQDAQATQLVTLGDNLAVSGADYGLTAEQIAYWQKGAAVNAYLQFKLIPAIRDFSGAATAARDELQLDKVAQPFIVPVFNAPPMPPLVQSALTEPLQTDFLDWCDHIYQTMKLTGGLSDSAAKALGFLVPAPAPVVPPSQMQPRITSIDTEAGGRTTVKVFRDNQAMIHCRLTLDSGQVFDKTLANSEFSFVVPTDRVHGISATAIYADKNGDDFGNWSEAKSDTSEL